MDLYYWIIIGFFVFVNLVAFFVMSLDKIRSRKSGVSRIPEGILFFMAIFFGSVGVYAGMFAFRHKTQKWYFFIGVPLLILENIASLVVVYQMLIIGGVL